MQTVHDRLRPGKRWSRQGAAAAELAILLPFLAFLLLVVVDCCRILRFTVMVENCARNGAVWASDSFAQAESPYTGVSEAARADFPPSLRNQLTVSDPAPVVQDLGVDYVEVTCSYSFQTLTGYTPSAGPWTIQRVVRARVVPRN